MTNGNNLGDLHSASVLERGNGEASLAIRGTKGVARITIPEDMIEPFEDTVAEVRRVYDDEDTSDTLIGDGMGDDGMPDPPDEDVTPDEWDSGALRAAINDGAPAQMLAHAAPTLALSIEALSFEYGARAVNAVEAMDRCEDDPERAAYWKGRLDAYGTSRGDLVAALMNHGEVGSFPLREREREALERSGVEGPEE